MNPTQIKIAGAGLFFIFIFLSGFWLSRYERPYHPLWFNVHKFIALGALVYLGVMVYRNHQAAPLGGLEMAAVGITAALFVITIITGGVQNIEKPLPAVLLTIHKVFPYLTTLSSAGTLYLLLR